MKGLKLRRGERIVVVHGPLQGRRGIVLDGEGSRVVMSIDEGPAALVEMDRDWVERQAIPVHSAPVA